MCPVGQHALEELSALAPGYGVIHHQGGVDVLGLTTKDGPGDVKFGPFALEQGEDVVAHESAARRQLERAVDASLSERGEPGGKVARSFAGQRALDVGKPCAVAKPDIAEGVGLA